MPTLTPRISSRQLDVALARTQEIVGRGHGDEHQADREQHLVEVAAAVHVTIERAFEHQTGGRGGQEGHRQAGEEWHAPAVHEDHRHVAAGHGEGAMRQIDEVHQAERHREPAGQHEQQHAVGHAVEQDGGHGYELFCRPSFETPRCARLLRMRSNGRTEIHLTLRSAPKGRVSKSGRPHSTIFSPPSPGP
jgi:hypothetical protein